MAQSWTSIRKSVNLADFEFQELNTFFICSEKIYPINEQAPKICLMLQSM